MNIIMGGTGHVGSAVAESLLAKNEPVTILTHDETKVGEWRAKGAEVSVVDVIDTLRLAKIFRGGKKLFLLNPSASPSGDPVAEEKKTMRSILRALDESRFEGIVALSTYGTQPGDGIGDLGVLFEMEVGLHQRGLPTRILRSGYLMSNWTSLLESARETGQLPTLYPTDFALPMVAPKDVGDYAAELLTNAFGDSELRFIEGPQLSTSADVAKAIGQTIGREVQAVTIMPNEWIASLQKRGFSEKAARSMAAMTKLTIEGHYEQRTPHRGTTTPADYFRSTNFGK